MDIDLTYLPVKPKNESYKEINYGLELIKDEISSKLKYKVRSSNDLIDLEK